MVRSFQLFAALSFLLALFPLFGHAEPASYRRIIEPTTFSYYTFVASSTHYTLETEITSTTGDTVLYLFKRGEESTGAFQYHYVAHNDDCQMEPSNQCPSLGQNHFLRSKMSNVAVNVGETYMAVVVAYNWYIVDDNITPPNWGYSYASNPGTAKLHLTNHTTGTTSVFNEQFFGGTIVPVNGTNNAFSPYDPTNTYVYETTSRGGYAFVSGTALLAMGKNSYGDTPAFGTIPLGFGLINGKGFHGRVETSGAWSVLVGTSHQAEMEPTEERSLYLTINDGLLPGRDADGDGLGLKLEERIGTCDRDEQIIKPGNNPLRCDQLAVTPNGTTVRRIFNYKDTDGDGIPDFDETFGLEGLYNEGGTAVYSYLDLPRYGASPHHKDIFLEIDHYENSSGHRLLDANFAQAVQNYFQDGPGHEINNPGLHNGIRIHMDIGVSPPANASPDEKMLYGSWGGSDVFVTENPFGTGDIHTHALDGTLANAFMKEIRRGIFHYAYVFRDSSGNGSGCPGQGIVNGWFFKVNYLSNVNSSNFSSLCGETFSHELGHNLGLLHGGHDKWIDVNGKPHYRSIMNYAFNYHPNTKFTTASTSTDLLLNPVAFLESQGLGQGIDPTYLNLAPFYLSVGTFDPFGFTPIDWNHSGNFEPQVLRHPVTLATSHGHGFQNLQTLSSFPTQEGRDNVKLVHVFPHETTFYTPPVPRLYMFYRKKNTQNIFRVFYRHGVVHHTPNTNSSCPGGDRPKRMNLLTHATEQADTCTSWSEEKEFPLPDNLLGVEVKNFAVTFVGHLNGNTFNRFMVALATPENNLYTAFSFDTNYSASPQQGVAAGEILGTSVPAYLAKENAQGTPEFTFSGASNGYPKDLLLFYRSLQSDYIWQRFRPVPLNDSSQWAWVQEKTVIDQTDQIASGEIPPTLLWWPSPGQPGHLCGIFTKTVSDLNRVRFLCLDESAGKWQDLTASAFGPEGAPATFGQTSLVFRHERHPDGTLAYPLSQPTGKYWFIYFGSEFQARMRLSRKTSNSPFAAFYSPQNPIFYAPIYSFGGNYKGISDFSLLEDLRLAGLKAAGIRFFPEGSQQELAFFPFADVVFNADLRTGSDFQVMSRGICTSVLQGRKPPSTGSLVPVEQICGAIEENLWGY